MALPITNPKYSPIHNHPRTKYLRDIRLRKIKNKVKANETCRIALMARGKNFRVQPAQSDMEDDLN